MPNDLNNSINLPRNRKISGFFGEFEAKFKKIFSAESLENKGVRRFSKKNFKIFQKIFQKPLDKSKISVII